MNVLIDTSVWSLVLRRATPSNDPHTLALRRLIDELRATIIGPIRQELLSGISKPAQYDALRRRLRHFPDLLLDVADYERAAEFHNVCRRNGVQGSNTDFLICAVAVGRDLAIFTTDRDYERYQAHIPLTLYRLREADRQ